MIEFSNVSKVYPNGVVGLDDVNLTIEQGEFVGIIGLSGAGKSTLMNHLIGQKIAITSNKPQTTRNRIQTVLTTEEGQIVFVDTPGIHKAKNKLAEKAENYAASREEKKRERELALEEKKSERAELMERYEKLYEEKSFGFQRLMKAFPDMKSRDNNETLEKFKIHFNIKKKDENKKDQAS